MNIDKLRLQDITLNSIFVSKIENSESLSIIVICNTKEEAEILINELKKEQFNFQYKIDNDNIYHFYIKFPVIDVELSINTHFTKNDYVGYKKLDSDLVSQIKVGYFYYGQYYCSSDYVNINDITPNICSNYFFYEDMILK